MAEMELVVGKRKVGQGSKHTGRGAWDGGLVMAGNLEEAMLNEELFIGANAFGTAVTTQAGLSATTPALTLYNPVGSGVLGVLVGVRVNITADPAAATDLCLAYNSKNAAAPATTTDGTMVCSRLGSTAVPKLRCYRIATLAAAPVAFRHLGFCDTAIVAGLVITDYVKGEVGIEEGVAISIQARTAVAIVAEFVWREVPLNLAA